MSRRRNPTVDSSTVTRVSAVFDAPYKYNDTVSLIGHVTTPHGFVLAMSDAVNDLCRYDVIAGGRHFVFRENGTRTKRGLVRRAREFAADAHIRAGTYRRKQ